MTSPARNIDIRKLYEAKDRIECDLYDWLENKAESKYRYNGDYMNQYSWSEYYLAELDEISYSFE
ncbi:hypothetical protein SAMN02910292_02135 [Lachnospiraceae bacterium XBB2008]|nr:hypothetical protein SAMN02910292_02135 [Lachnospiraceae bacterium XBB2008]